MKKVIPVLAVLLTLAMAATAWADSAYFTPQQGEGIKAVLKTAFPGDTVTIEMTDKWLYCLVQCWAKKSGEYFAFRVYNPGVKIAGIGEDTEKIRDKADKLKSQLEAIFNLSAKEELGRNLIK